MLFLCTYNSARSQMAEGMLRHFGNGRLIDISGQESKTLARYLDQTFDQVITRL